MNDFCCEVFPKIMGKFSWMSYDNGKQSILCMPYIQIEKTKYRINSCPSCGADVRHTEISAIEYSKLIL